MEPIPSNRRETLVVSRRPLPPAGMEEVLRLALPAMAASVSMVIMNFTDAMMVAGVGSGAVGAVTGAGILYHVVTAAVGGLLGAVVAFSSQAYGRGEPREAARYAWQGVYVGLALGAAALVLLPALDWFFARLGHDTGVQAMETGYSKYLLLSTPLMAGVAVRSFLQGIGRTKLIMVLTAGTSALNILMNWLLIFGVGPFPEMGVEGAGLATFLSSAAGAALFFGAFLFGSAAREHEVRRAVRPSWSRIKGLVRIGAPLAMHWSLELAAWATWHTVLVGRLGRESFDANGAVLRITMMAWFPVMGIGQATSSLTGWYLGRGRPESARSAVRNAARASTAYMVAIAVVLFFGSQGLMRFFFVLQNPAQAEAAARAATVVALGAAALRVAAMCQVFDGLNITLGGALHGGGDTLWPSVATQAMTWLFFLPLAWVLCFPVGLGMVGAWWAAAAHLTLLSGVLYLRYRGTAWMRKDIFRDRAGAPDGGLTAGDATLE